MVWETKKGALMKSPSWFIDLIICTPSTHRPTSSVMVIFCHHFHHKWEYWLYCTTPNPCITCRALTVLSTSLEILSAHFQARWLSLSTKPMVLDKVLKAEEMVWNNKYMMHMCKREIGMNWTSQKSLPSSVASVVSKWKMDRHLWLSIPRGVRGEMLWLSWHWLKERYWMPQTKELACSGYKDMERADAGASRERWNPFGIL